jgi:ATP-binding cassette subfamily F protein uup
MALLSLFDVRMAFGAAPVLDGVCLQIEPGERICLIGRNGEGKTTLMKILHGILEPLEGQIVRRPGLQTAMLQQTVPTGIRGSVFEVVSEGLGRRSQLLQDYHRLSRRLAVEGAPDLMKQLDRLQQQIEAAGAWHARQQVETVISHLKLDPEAETSTLSAGLKRRTLLALALVLEPDILLLDEPTNHLDIDSIVWLEEFLKNLPSAVVFVTHDRSFVQSLSTRIVDIDRGRVTSWQCSYADFTVRKQAQLDAEAGENRRFDKKLAQEEAWIRTGIQARRTRNEGRVRELMKMREQRRQRRQLAGKVKIQTQSVQTSGRLVLDVLGVSFSYDRRDESKRIIDNFTATIMKGDKIGLIGPNGCGKTTLLKVLLGELRPTDGTIRRGTHLEVAYFDQLHAQLDENRTVWENVADGYSTITWNGAGRSVVGYLQDFLFPPRQAAALVSTLSGGERNRLLLARLFAKPANVLVLDEPTNDLDIETLELLEELLVQYEGTVLLVSHDRTFLNNVVTGTYVFEGAGRIREYVGGYDDWLRQRPAPARPAEPKEKKERSRPTPNPNKMSYREKRELEALPAQIEERERQLADLTERMARPDFYKQDSALIAETAQSIGRLQEELARLYERWQQLEELTP